MSQTGAFANITSDLPTGLRTRRQLAEVAISFRVMLAVYSIVPIVCAILLLDLTVFHQSLKAILPASPYVWPGFLVFFVYPHIFASQFSLFDREYINAYRWRLLVGAPVVLVLSLVVLWPIDRRTNWLVFHVITMYHVLFQQIGLARMMMGTANASFYRWKWLSFALTTTGAVLILNGWRSAGPWFGAASLGCLPLLSYFAHRAASASQTRLGTWYLWANHSLIAMGLVCFAIGYPVFSILMIRVVHDVTGFLFYAAHDHNRNIQHVHNILYRALSITGIPVLVLGSLLAILMNAAFLYGGGFIRYPALFSAIAYLHYYTEGLIWKRHTIHRQSISFAH